MRTFFCLNCRTKEATEDGKPPVGWLSLAIVIEEGSSWRSVSAFSRLGLFCSFGCMVKRGPVIAREIGEEWVPPTAGMPAVVAGAS